MRVQMCDRSCNNELCGFDGADCGIDQLREELYRVELTPDIANVTVRAVRERRGRQT